MGDEAEALEQAAGENEETSGNEVDQELIDRATEMGWVPQDQWRGDPEKWTSAEEYVRKGEEVLPVIRANNRRLNEQLSRRDGELRQANSQIAELRESVEALKEIQQREAGGRLDRQIRSTRTQIEEARQERDTDKVVELEERLEELQDEKSKLGRTAEPRRRKEEQNQVAPEVQAEIEGWQEANPWFGQDKTKTRLANAISLEMRREPELKDVKGRAFLDEVSRRTEEAMEELSGGGGRQPSKVGPGSTSGGRSPSGTTRGKSFADLPADAKAAFADDVRRVVGDGKAFKTEEDYKTWFVKQYFEEE